MHKILSVIIVFFLSTGCSYKSPETIEVEKKSNASHQRQYIFDQQLHEHRGDIQELQGEVNEVISSMSGESRSSYTKDSGSYSKQNNNHGYSKSNIETMCDEIYMQYVETLANETDKRVVYNARQKYWNCKKQQRYLQNNY